MEPGSQSLAPDFFRGKRLVVFGAGYVGEAVIRRAVAAGAQVTALTRNAERASALEAAGVGTVQADLAEEAWHARMPAAEFVLDCVGAGGGGMAGYRRSYVDGLRSILRWAARSGLGGAALVYTSSTSVYPQDGGVRVDETAPTAGIDERGRILLEAEQLALQWPGPATVLRLAGIYGPGRHHLLDTLRSGEAVIPGRGDHRLNLIHRDDAVAAILAAFAQPEAAAGAVFNVADDGPVPKQEVVEWLAGRLDRPSPRFTGLPVPSRRSSVPDRLVDNARAKRVLGWRPAYPTFREGYAGLL